MVKVLKHLFFKHVTAQSYQKAMQLHMLRNFLHTCLVFVA